ncbi:MAG: NAD(P)-dependent oxidoreductase [Phycisphaerales bacterium]
MPSSSLRRSSCPGARAAAEAERWLEESRCRVVRASPDGAGVGSSGAPSGDGRSGGDGEFWSQLAVADALVVRTYTIVDEAMLARAPRLRVVGRAGVGVDNIDLVACRRRSIVVVNTPDANTQAVVEYVLCLLCDALRPRLAAGLRTAISAEAWNRMRNEVVGRRQLGECTLGVLGLGRIGRRVAEVARAIGMRVLYNDLRTIDAAERAGAVPVDDATLFADSDIVSIHIDGRPENRRFVDAALVDHEPDVVFINTSRASWSTTWQQRSSPAIRARWRCSTSTIPSRLPPTIRSPGLPNARLDGTSKQVVRNVVAAAPRTGNADDRPRPDGAAAADVIWIPVGLHAFDPSPTAAAREWG